VQPALRINIAPILGVSGLRDELALSKVRKQIETYTNDEEQTKTATRPHRRRSTLTWTFSFDIMRVESSTMSSEPGREVCPARGGEPSELRI
jgi:hypothetical protein